MFQSLGIKESIFSNFIRDSSNTGKTEDKVVEKRFLMICLIIVIIFCFVLYSDFINLGF